MNRGGLFFLCCVAIVVAFLPITLFYKTTPKTEPKPPQFHYLPEGARINWGNINPGWDQHDWVDFTIERGNERIRILMHHGIHGESFTIIEREPIKAENEY